ncbi:MAG: FeoA family protein [Planctomycetota bacterium]
MNQSGPETCTLQELPPGQQARLVRITGGHRLHDRLASLGFAPEVPIEVVSRQGSGPILVLVNRTRVAIGQGMAAQVLVRPI